MVISASLTESYFNDIFSSDPDPWSFRTSPYERNKYQRTIDVLGDRMVDRAFEVGCANGELTALLAKRCRVLESIDISERAVNLARSRCHSLTNVTIDQAVFPSGLSVQTGQYDLAVLSEVLYYLSTQDLRAAAKWLGQAMRPKGAILLVHWTGRTNYPQSADTAVGYLLEELGPRIDVQVSERHDRFRLDLWQCR